MKQPTYTTKRPRIDLKPWMREQIHNVIGTDSSLDRIVLFGSRAKGTFREGSDIDLAVYGPGLSGADASWWIDELEERLFPWSVDIVVVHEETDQELRDQVARVGVEIWGGRFSGEIV